jgi:hypothetical protein
MRSLEAAWALACLGLLTGCPPTSLYRTAEPTPKDTWQFTAGVGVGQSRDTEQETKIPIGAAELGVRRGLTDDLDVGARLFVPGVDLNATWRLLHRGMWSVAVAPQVAIVRMGDTAATTNSLNLFSSLTSPVTYRFSRSWALTFAPLVGGGAYWPKSGGHATGLWLGGAVNVEWRARERVWLVPELSGYRVVAGEVPTRGGAVLFGVGARFGLL